MAAFHCEDCNNNDCGNCTICHDNDSLDMYNGDDYSESLYIPDEDD